LKFRKDSKRNRETGIAKTDKPLPVISAGAASIAKTLFIYSSVRAYQCKAKGDYSITYQKTVVN